MRRVVLPILLGLMCHTTMFAQEDVVVVEPDKANKKELVFVFAEEMPEFQGGNGKIMPFIKKNMQYPEVAIEKGLEGKVYVTFVVAADGGLKDVRVKHSSHPELNEEAIRLVNLTSGKWKPGRQRGKEVNVMRTIPVDFKLSGAAKKAAKKTAKSSSTSDDVVVTEVSNDGKVYDMVYLNPQFKDGGMLGLMKFLRWNLTYPKEARKNGIEGRVYVTYEVMPNGTLRNVRIKKGVHPLLDEEAIRVIKLTSGKWEAGRLKDGTAVIVSRTYPLEFKMKKK